MVLFYRLKIYQLDEMEVKKLQSGTGPRNILIKSQRVIAFNSTPNLCNPDINLLVCSFLG